MHSPFARYGLLAAASAVLVAACGNDSEDGFQPEDRPPIPADWDPQPYCDAALALETADAPEIDWESMSPDEAAQVVRQHASDSLLPHVNDMAAAAPEAFRSDIDDLVVAYEHLAETGDYAVLDEGGLPILDVTVHGFALDQCGWNRVELTVSDYAFEGLPETYELSEPATDVLDAPVTSFDFRNNGEEVHELALFRKAEGVTAAAEELLELPQEEAMSMLEMVGAPEVIEPGHYGYKVAALEPGDYIAVCFIPTGTTDLDDAPGDAPPHFTHGMFAELTVLPVGGG